MRKKSIILLTCILLILCAVNLSYSLEKNTANQKWIIFCFDDTDNSAKTGDAANITANLRIDGGTANAVDDTNPTELEDGYYIFDITAAESNGESIVICPDSSTANIQCIGCPMALYTRPPNHSDMDIDATNGQVDADITYVGGDAITDNGDGRLEVNIEEISDVAVSTSTAQLGVNVVNYGGSAVTATVSGIPDVNVTYWEDDAVPATTDGYPAVNVDEWDNTDVSAAVAGYPEVNVTHWEDSAITDADATPDVDVDTIEGSDATDQIRDSVVDDATRIDASSVNAVEAKVDTVDGVVDTILIDTAAYDTDAEYATALWNAATASYGGAGTYGQAVEDIIVDTAEIGSAGAGLSAVPWNSSWDAEVESEVDDSIGGGTGTALTAIPWNSSWDTEVESEVDDALVVQELDHLVHVADVDEPADNSIIAKLAASDGDWSGFDNTTDSLEAIKDAGGGGITAADVWNYDIPSNYAPSGTSAGSVLDKLTEETTTLSSDVALGSAIGQMLDNGTAWSYDRATDSLEALRDNQAAAADAVLMQNTTITVTDQTHFTLGAGSSDDDAYNNMVAVFTDQVTSEQKSVRTITDYTGSSKTVTIDSAPDFTIATGDTIDILAVAPGSTPPTAAQIADAVLQESVDDHSATANSLAEHIDEIQVDTSDIETDLNDGVSLTSATETQIDAIETDTSELQTNQNWNVWDDGTRALTELDEDNTTIDLDGSRINLSTTTETQIDDIETKTKRLRGGR